MIPRMTQTRGDGAATGGAQGTVAQRLARFVVERSAGGGGGVPAAARHEAARLVLNQLKASVGATTHPAIGALHDWVAEKGASGRPASVLWLGTQVPAEDAAALNGALFEVLDFNETHIPTYVHATSAVAPAALAEAERLGVSGRRFLDALAVGLEVDLVLATLLMPGTYVRGWTPGTLVGGIGAAAAVAGIRGLDEATTAQALAIAMTGATGAMEAIGSSTFAANQGFAARAGVVACELAARGIETGLTAFEGEKGLLSCASGESPDRIDGVLGALDAPGRRWLMQDTAYKRLPTETITQAPLDCVLEIRARLAARGGGAAAGGAGALPEVARMRFLVEPIVARVSAERFARFGTPRTDLQARFDLRFCAASAWTRGRFTLDEMAEAAYTDPAILALRGRVDVDPDEGRTLDGASLEVTFADGSVETAEVPAFRGAAGNPLTDDELAGVFRTAAAGCIPDEQAARVLAELWGLETAPSVHALVAATRPGAGRPA